MKTFFNKQKERKFITEEQIDKLMSIKLNESVELYEMLESQTSLQEGEIRTFDFSFVTNLEKKANNLKLAIKNIYELNDLNISFDKRAKTYYLDCNELKLSITSENLTFTVIDLFWKGVNFDCLLEGFGAMREDTVIFPVISKEKELEYLDIAIKAFEKGNFSGAIINFSNVIQCNPNNAYAYYSRGTAIQELHLFKRAIEDYNKALDLDNSKANIILLNRGAAKDELGDFEEAINDYNKVLAEDSSIIDAYVNRGNSKFKLNDFEGAKQDWIKAKELGADDVDFRLDMLPK